jgi:hypothetical protein
MEKRRTALLFLPLGLTLAAAAQACEPGIEGVRLESARHALAYRSAALAVGQHFALDVAACSKAGKPPEALTVDAHMPEHRHGMNYRPTVTRVAPGRWRAEGLMFHMPGRWELTFDVHEGASAVRLTDSIVLR